VFQDKDDLWLWNCFAGFGEGDEITFLRKLELTLTFDEWYRLSQSFLDSEKTRDDYLASFLAEFGKSARRQAKANHPRGAGFPFKAFPF
jgi:hypothetical protein